LGAEIFYQYQKNQSRIIIAGRPFTEAASSFGISIPSKLPYAIAVFFIASAAIIIVGIAHHWKDLWRFR
jgi:hypothetical protein